MENVTWNLWHGCTKYSEGCQNCYVYRADMKYDRDPKTCVKTSSFDLPIKKDRNGNYKIKSGTRIWTCFSSDFFLKDADEWRNEAWNIIRERRDCHFIFITKRILRFYECIPKDWNDGWDNVTIIVTVENQKRVDERLPFFVDLPIKHKCITSEPMLGKIDLEKYLSKEIEEVVVGGESGEGVARLCDYEWILDVRDQCVRQGISFVFKQTGAKFRKDGKVYDIPRKSQHEQARKAKINYICNGIEYLYEDRE